jgi:hypothetical protein
MQESLRLYGAQEKAVKNLADALSLIGKGGIENVRAMEQFASSIQKVTTLGDEAVLEIMAMGSSMGKLSGDKLKEATKAAIGLSKAYKMELVGAMRLVARAAQGDTATLARYGIKLGDITDSQEKFNKVLEIGVKNFGLAVGEAKTFSGAIQQAKNAIGDMKEKIGAALAPVVKSWAEQTKKWAEENGKVIAEWVAKTVNAVILVKDVFLSFIDFLKTDWISATRFAFNSFLEIMKAAFHTAVTMAIAAGRGIAKGIKTGLINELDIKTWLIKKYPQLFPGAALKKAMAAEKEKRSLTPRPKQTPEDLWLKQAKKLMAGSTKAVVSHWSKALEQIKSMAPPAFSDAAKKDWQKFQDRLKKTLTGVSDDMRKGLAGATAAATADAAPIVQAKKTVAETPKKLAALESRFLTFKPGTVFDRTARRTAGNTSQLVQAARRRLGVLQQISRNTRGMEKIVRLLERAERRRIPFSQGGQQYLEANLGR